MTTNVYHSILDLHLTDATLSPNLCVDCISLLILSVVGSLVPYIVIDCVQADISSMDSVRYTGARRGVFGLQNWAPLREPGQPVSFVNDSHDRQSVNAPAPCSPLFHAEQSQQTALQQKQQQQLPYAAQQTVLQQQQQPYAAQQTALQQQQQLPYAAQQTAVQQQQQQQLPYVAQQTALQQQQQPYVAQQTALQQQQQLPYAAQQTAVQQQQQQQLPYVAQQTALQQQQPYAAQSTLLADKRAEPVASNCTENTNAVKPCELFVGCFHLYLMYIYIIQNNSWRDTLVALVVV